MTAKSNDPAKQKQHFIPKQYLQRFADADGKLRVMKADGTIIRPGTGSIGKQGGLYDLTATFPDVPSLGAIAEKTYKEFEDKFGSALIDTIDQGRFPNRTQSIEIAEFALLQAGRTPQMHSNLGEYLEKKSDKPPEKQSDLVALGFLHNLASLTRTIESADIDIFRFPCDCRLVSSDNPSTIWVTDRHGGREWAHSSIASLLRLKANQIKGRYVHFPISPRFYMRIKANSKSNTRIRLRDRGTEAAHDLNIDTLTTAIRFSIL